MHLNKVLTLVAVLAGISFTAPAAEAEAGASKSTNTRKPTNTGRPKPQPTIVDQSNQCGTGITPYCCNTDNRGQFTSCYAIASGSQCSTTIVCCNAQDSIQVCLGNVNIGLI